VTLTSSTVTENSAAGAGGGVYVFDLAGAPALTIANSIVAGNTDDGTAPDLMPDPHSTLNIDFSLIGVTDGLTITGGNNLTGTAALPLDPLLGVLANNGGPTETHALLVGSPAIDAGNPSIVFNPAEFDQRGAPFARVADGRIDIGAYELQTVVDSADFDNDNDIDGFDFLTWQRGFGTPSASPADGDANNDNSVDAADLSIWESQFGGPAPLAAVGSSQVSVSSNEATPLVANEQAVGSNEALIDAAIAVEWLRNGPVSEAPPLVANEPALAETYADQVFAAEATAPAGLFADAYELLEPNSGEADTAESPWLADELLERVFG